VNYVKNNSSFAVSAYTAALATTFELQEWTNPHSPRPSWWVF